MSQKLASLHPKTGHVVFLIIDTASVMAPVIESARLAGHAERQFEAAAFLIPERVCAVRDGTPWLAEWIQAPEHGQAFNAAAKAERLSLRWAPFRPELTKWDFTHFTRRDDWLRMSQAQWSFAVTGAVEGNPIKHLWQVEGLRRALDAMAQSVMATAPAALGVDSLLRKEDFPRPFMTAGQMREWASEVEAAEPSLAHVPQGGPEYAPPEIHRKFTQLETMVNAQAGAEALRRANALFSPSKIAARLDARDLASAVREASAENPRESAERAPSRRL